MDFELINSTIAAIPFVKKINSIERREFSIVGNVEILLEELGTPLTFDFQINSEYPLKSYDSESINFSNKELVSYNHVMQNGSICIHTSHSTSITEKLRIDFNALKDWIIKYVVNKDEDLNYEHIVVTESPINDTYYSFMFTECKESFYKDELGTVKLSLFNDGILRGKKNFNFFIQKFVPINGEPKNCQWNQYYNKQRAHLEGLYYYIEDAPVTNGRFAYTNWSELNLPQNLLNLLHQHEREKREKLKGRVIPLFIGYKTVGTEIHWQAALLEIGKFPIKGVPEKFNGHKTGKWNTHLVDTEIKWGLTRNSSYQYFFGRGVFSKVLTEKKILIIGVGAVGSIIAQTLTRGGCKYIDFIDHDIKEPENVCRSEYKFANGITSKTVELEKNLYEISPFLNSIKLNDNYFETLIKTFYSDTKRQKKFIDDLKPYDLIFDCSTDNDLMYVLNSLKLETDLINISITNHAKELICAFHPNIYNFVNNQFSNVLKNDVEDLYEPTGCWNPTFKASYNDINVLVQLALKHINKIISGEKAKNNFVIHEADNSLKIVEF
ncbi:MAG: ThiF family adenylyltransferase [Crocinitomicaceae bacterium]|nr:ThiF family adenylyltransferase [Crocinitomicaceae bacterium]